MSGMIRISSDSKSGSYKLLKTVTATSYVDKTAASGRTYFYKVVAKSTGAAKSGYSNKVKVTCG